MKCLTPIKAWYYKGDYKAKGLKSPILFAPPLSYNVDTDLCDKIELPCGHCLACDQNKSNKWTTRIMAESYYYGSSLFLTLTYNDEHIPCNFDGDYTLSKRDIQLFLKRLRKKYPLNDIRYYCCGEYGSTTLRPHYHMILFGFQPSDLVLYKRNGERSLYTSLDINNLWKNGFAVIGLCTPQSIAYTAKYSTKQSNYAEILGIEKPFRLASRNPAVGLRFFKDYYEQIFALGAVHLNGKKRSIPEYYKRKLKEIDEVMYETYKCRVRDIVQQMKAKEDLLSLDEIYDNENNNFKFYERLEEFQNEKRYL